MSNGQLGPGKQPGKEARAPRVVVTQAAYQAGPLIRLLATRGAEPLPYPCIAIEPPDDLESLNAALHDLAAGHYGWLVVTSANTVRVVAERLAALGLVLPVPRVLRIAAVGPATAEAVQSRLERTADLLPDEHVAEGLAAALLAALQQPGQQPGESRQRVLLPQGDLARSVLGDALTAAGIETTGVIVYRTTAGSGGVDLPALLAAGTVDAITFTASSTVRNLLARLDAEGGDRAHLANVTLACIGPITAATLREAGLTPAVVATEQSMPGLVEALFTYWNGTQ